MYGMSTRRDFGVSVVAYIRYNMKTWIIGIH